MSDALPANYAQDSAWASIRTPFTRQKLLEFCADTERLFRINPFLEFDQWRRLGAGHYQVSGRNFSQTPAFAFSLELRVEERSNGFRFNYSNGIKAFTDVMIEDDPVGSKLTITDNYSAFSEEELQQRLGEVDRSLIKWATDLQTYLIMWKRWSRIAPWRWYMGRIWQPLKPSARRIVYMLLWISVVEMALIALGAMIYWIEFA